MIGPPTQHWIQRSNEMRCSIRLVATDLRHTSFQRTDVRTRRLDQEDSLLPSPGSMLVWEFPHVEPQKVEPILNSCEP